MNAPLAFFRRDLLAAGATAVLVVAVVAAAAGPWLAPYDPLGVDLASNYQPSSWAHPLGTDHLGRDTLSRLVVGARFSLGIALAATGAGLLIGAVIGLLAAWRRGVIDLVFMQLVDILLALPELLLAITAITVLGRGTVSTVVAVAIYAVPSFARIVRAAAARVLSPNGRLMGTGVWAIVYFLIDSFVFMLIGLQLPIVVGNLADQRSAAELIGLGLAVSLTAIVARFVWIFPWTYLPFRFSARWRATVFRPPRASVFVVAWAGMRGAVSLAAALSLPLEPTPFPERDLLIYLTFCVILATLVGQGLTLPWIVNRLGLVAGRGIEREEGLARQAAIDAALERLDDLALEYPDHLELVDQLRARYTHEADHAAEDLDIGESERELLAHQAIRAAVIEVQREAIIGLRDDGAIGDLALRRVERDLDLEVLRTGA